jgi:hypothetical protein
VVLRAGLLEDVTSSIVAGLERDEKRDEELVSMTTTYLTFLDRDQCVEGVHNPMKQVGGG